jgi:hypothetical protein
MISHHRELKRLSLEFRDAASGVLRADSEHARTNIRRLLGLVARSPLLAAEIGRSVAPADDPIPLFTTARDRHSRMGIPDDPLEELGQLHRVLEELGKEHKDDFWKLCYRYGGKTGPQDCVTEVLHDIAGRYTKHLSRVLEVALLESSDTAYDARRVEVTVGDHSQVNFAQDSATIHATQTVHREAAEVIRLASELLAVARSVQSVEAEEVAAAVIEEVKKPKPRFFTLESAVTKLQLLATGGKVGQEIVEGAQKLWPQIQHLMVLARAHTGL